MQGAASRGGAEAVEPLGTGQDVVYANLAGDLVPMTRSVVRAMDEAGVRRLIWISPMRIHDEAASPEMEVRHSVGVRKLE